MNGDHERALETIKQCHIKTGKVETYLEVFESLRQGKIPKLYSGHALFGVNWKKDTLRAESVPGKIIAALKERPRSKDELIRIVWGEDAVDVSYVARLHAAIKYVRKEKGIPVSFDGEKYAV